ncbi:hypothetical protein HDV00_008330 [Rhizophlyctis rosea]|nr:hypothetical protein HDV00_008330 [Rhizophlyctis rosea]
MPTKPKCTFWNKCFRKNPQHLAEYLHPADVDAPSSDTDADAKEQCPHGDKCRLKSRQHLAKYSHSTDDASPAKPKTPTFDAEKTIIDSDRDASDDEPVAPKSKAPPQKKKKPAPKREPSEDEDEDEDEDEEDDYQAPKKAAAAPSKTATSSQDDRPKCQFWDRCGMKNAGHLAKFLHPADLTSNNGVTSDSDAEKSDSDQSPSPPPSPPKKPKRKLPFTTDAAGPSSSSNGTSKGKKKAKIIPKEEEEEEEGDHATISVGDTKVVLPKKAIEDVVLAGVCKCGKKNDEDANFCNKCGSRLVAAIKAAVGDVEDDEEEVKEEEDSKEEDELASINGITPKNVLNDGDVIEIESSSSSAKYRIKRTWDHYYCTCMAWRNQGGMPVNARTCKHLKEHLGEAYEMARLKMKNPDGQLPIASSSTKASKKRKAAAADDDEEDEDDDDNPAPAKKVKNTGPPALLLANKYEDKVDPTGWWISEKLDGVRALWDPARKTFVSRLGNPFTAPAWFVQDLPKDMSLDGELFAGRGEFASTVSVVKTINSPHWHKIKFHIFDAPSIGHLPFESRLDKIKKWATTFPTSSPPSSSSSKGKSKATDPPSKATTAEHITLVDHEKCKNRKHVTEMLGEVEKKGGEGLMLRKPGSLYEGKRSGTLLKVKSFYDAEAVVIGHEPGKGKHTGACGALKCKMESGKLFNVGTGMSDAERRNPPPKGAIITYRFQELTNDGVPRFPSYIGVRVDATGPKDYVFKK